MSKDKISELKSTIADLKESIEVLTSPDEQEMRTTLEKEKKNLPS